MGHACPPRTRSEPLATAASGSAFHMPPTAGRYTLGSDSRVAHACLRLPQSKGSGGVWHRDLEAGMVLGNRRRSSRVALAVLAAVLLLSPAWGQSTLAQLRAEVQADPGSVAAWVALGNAQYEAGEYDQARESFLEAIALDYLSGDAHYGLGITQFSRGDYQAALFEFNEVARLYPERFDGQFNRAVTLARLRRPAEAADAFRAALQQAEPEASAADRVRAHLGLAGQLELTEERGAAAEAYGAALELEPA